MFACAYWTDEAEGDAVFAVCACGGGKADSIAAYSPAFTSHCRDSFAGFLLHPGYSSGQLIQNIYT